MDTGRTFRRTAAILATVTALAAAATTAGASQARNWTTSEEAERENQAIYEGRWWGDVPEMERTPEPAGGNAGSAYAPDRREGRGAAAYPDLDADAGIGIVRGPGWYGPGWWEGPYGLMYRTEAWFAPSWWFEPAERPGTRR